LKNAVYHVLGASYAGYPALFFVALLSYFSDDPRDLFSRVVLGVFIFLRLVK